jgi:hypothetical protein
MLFKSIPKGEYMKKVALFVLCIMCISSLSYAGSVRGYTRSNGTYVAPHQRSNSDNTYTNNWSYKGNVNPYTGKVGTNSYDDYNPNNSNSSTRSRQGVSDMLGTFNQ